MSSLYSLNSVSLLLCNAKRFADRCGFWLSMIGFFDLFASHSVIFELQLVTQLLESFPYYLFSIFFANPRWKDIFLSFILFFFRFFVFMKTVVY